ncbi:O-antigen ligase family protein [Pasteurella oralis]|uniref:O-antigen ligase family protein n=1 Tax=Pasteurella oralis TaxID=1071947 RepID=A0ABW4NWS7_9PAST
MAFCLVSTLSALFGRFLSTARGGWIGLPIIVPLILYCFIAITLITIVSVATLPLFKAMQRVYQAQDEITAYFVANNGSTSVGARFDMWKSALLMAREKPILGWGVEGVGEERKRQAEQQIISQFAGQFNHVHNQYLDDLSKRGVL